MNKTRTHFPITTAQQRRLLFAVWEETSDRAEACRRAHVSQSTFYNWKPRFEAGGSAALAETGSHAPHHPQRTAADIAVRVVTLRRSHPDWGKRRIADEMAKGNNWVPLVSPNTVKRILQDADLWPAAEGQAKKGGPATVARTADAPGQTLNIDLCFVPATHEAAEKLPAVSGSSGRLVDDQAAAPAAERQWPGQVFADERRAYAEVMLDFVAASNRPAAAVETGDLSEAQAVKQHKQALRLEEAHLRDERRQIRQQRQLENAAWQALQAERQAKPTASSAAAAATPSAQDDHWRNLRRQRRETVAQRAETDQAWRQKRLDFRERWSQLPSITAWIAILVITDNCTRQCLGLPLFVAGPTVTAEMLVEALRRLLPPDLLFLISDRGVHFRAETFTSLMRDKEFVHVLIARHRPQSNGIAERFVRSLKEWLRDKSWQDDQELAALVDQFRAEYNDRPHQGLALPGLSPDEFANRIWLF